MNLMIQKPEKNLPKEETCSVQWLLFSDILSASADFTQYCGNQINGCDAVLTVKRIQQVSTSHTEQAPLFPTAKAAEEQSK